MILAIAWAFFIAWQVGTLTESPLVVLGFGLGAMVVAFLYMIVVRLDDLLDQRDNYESESDNIGPPAPV